MDAINAARLLLLALIYAGPNMREGTHDTLDEQDNAVTSLINDDIRNIEAQTKQEDEVVRALLHKLLVSKRAHSSTGRGADGGLAPFRSRNSDMTRRFPFKTEHITDGPACQFSGTCSIGWKRSIRKRRSTSSINNGVSNSRTSLRHRNPLRLAMRPTM